MKAIVDSESLFATDLRFLNDSRELSHARDMIADRANFLSHSQNLAPEYPVGALGWLISILEERTAPNVYVTSFTEKGDDLSQWRGYTPTGRGVAIGFDSTVLGEVAANLQKGVAGLSGSSASLGKVIYLADNEGESFDPFILSVADYASMNEGEVVQSHFDILINQATPFYKHNSFSDEAEWRISLVEGDLFEIPLNVDFRVGLSSMVPYTRIDFGAKSKDLLKEVILGPTPNPETSLIAAKAFFRSRGFDRVTVKPSAIPFRAW